MSGLKEIHLHPGHFNISMDDRQEVVEVVSDATSQHAEGFEFARTQHLLFGLRKALGARRSDIMAQMLSESVLLSIFAPYTAEECWALLGHEPSVAKAGWPSADPALLVEDLVTCIVQVAGKVRDRLEVPPGIGEDELRELALAAPGVARALADREVRMVIVRAPRLVNVVPV